MGFRYALDELWDRYQVPLFPVENGLGTQDTIEDGKIHNPYRIEYLEKHLKTLKEAISKEDAEKLVAELKEAGAEAEIK